MDRYRERRSPERVRDSRYASTTQIDSYVPPSSSRAARPRSRSPGGYRARSRTPPRATDSYRGRPSSPPRRGDSRADSYPSRDARPRSPRKDYPATSSRYEITSKSSRDRSPQPPRRARDPSPHLRSARSPARDSRTSYRPRSRSPRREERIDTHTAKSWRRSPSPRGDSSKNSSAISRRSSPRPPYPRRPTDSVPADDSRNASSYRSPRPRSPPPPRRDSPLARTTTPHRNDIERDSLSNGQGYARETPLATAGPDQRDRVSSSGPSGYYRESQPSAMPVPTGPSSSSASISAHNRYGPPTTPTYGRGGYSGGFRGRGGLPASRDYPPLGRGQSSWSLSQSYGRGAGQTPGGPPTAPAAASGAGRDAYPARDPASPYEHSRGGLARRGSGFSGGAYPFRGSGNGTSLTTPRTQRFNQAMSGIGEIKPGGEKLPPLHDTGRADKLEEEAARLRKLIDDKEIKKRQGLKEWDKLERESANAALRSELAEEHLRSLNGEGQGMAAAF